MELFVVEISVIGHLIQHIVFMLLLLWQIIYIKATFAVTLGLPFIFMLISFKKVWPRKESQKIIALI